jgi:hypothetical protein
MARMLDLIRASAVSQHQMMSAAKGALRVPAEEMVEILVYIAEHNKIFGEPARLTLAAWDELSAKQIAADPQAPKEVLDYWLAPKNIRPLLFEILLENPSVPMTKLAELAATLHGEFVDTMIASPRVRSSMQMLNDLSANHNLSGAQAARVQALIKGTTYEELEAQRQESQPEPADSATTTEAPAETVEHSEPADPEAERVVVAFLTEHAAEIAAEPEKPFQPLGGIHEEQHLEEPAASAAAAGAGDAASSGSVAPSATDPRPAPHKKPLVNPQDEQRGSVLQKIAKLDVKGRIQLAMKGTKEERAILVRDGTKLVAMAVLDSPKISDGEVEKIATQRNVLEAVLRGIPMKRRFAKNYAVVRNLVFNPRTPLDIGLGLIKNLLVSDLRNLSGNKEVSETLRKVALRMFKQKSESPNKN